MGPEFFIFAAVGFFAQIVDGALGMAYGVVSSTMLLAFGVPPAAASASVHAAEMFTTAASATSHVSHRNVNWRLFWRLAPAGILGGILGTYVLTAIDGAVLRPFVTIYLGLLGIYILFRAFRIRGAYKDPRTRIVLPLGVAGGFVDAAGGGGWGPIVTSSLIGSGGAPRYVVGTVNTVEFFVTTAVSIAFVTALLTGHWEEADGIERHIWSVAGLVVGGVLAAPLAGFVVRMIPAQRLMMLVGGLVMALACFQTWQLLS
ncbi:sulfite exporter TauE/SafE family protein [Devosia sp. YIM 151766]|uniref:sulfite exporter TauE/SafE family protein n=1 Tax=Devosia sp. YIM 151766 TaxID=3017325 RepID=UPI00255C86FC|nr:sulfite exporter TauE/SafE family protein [Devosia sp. YIM 151766]WIY52212.1 sulfite exporter TauE/SafE family protein [Devosia sp. YIM 151766]